MGNNIVGRGVTGQGVIVGDEIKALVFGLEGKVLTHSAEIVADVQLAGWLYARKYSHVNLLVSFKWKKNQPENANNLQNNNLPGRECQEFRWA
jgi:hypothetical protein